MDKQASAAIRDNQIHFISKGTHIGDETIPKSINVFQSILSSRSLPMHEKEAGRIAQEGFVVLVAGGETTARVLTTATYHLLACKGPALQKLRGELENVMVDPHDQVDVKTLEQLPWLVGSLSLSLYKETANS